MRKDRNREIDQHATQILKAALPSASWEVYDIHPDIGKDHLVERVDKGKYLGNAFIVQLKGQERVKLSRDAKFVRYRLETRHLAYFETHQIRRMLMCASGARLGASEHCDCWDNPIPSSDRQTRHNSDRESRTGPLVIPEGEKGIKAVSAGA